MGTSCRRTGIRSVQWFKLDKIPLIPIIVLPMTTSQIGAFSMVEDVLSVISFIQTNSAPRCGTPVRFHPVVCLLLFMPLGRCLWAKSVTHFYWIEFSVVKQDFSSQFSVETQVLWRPWSHQILSSRINIIKHSMLFKRRLQ